MQGVMEFVGLAKVFFKGRLCFASEAHFGDIML